MFHPKCGAMSKSKYLVHCKSIIQYVVFRKILPSNFLVMTNSKLLKIYLYLKNIEFINLNIFKVKDKNSKKFKIDTTLFIESQMFTFNIDRLEELALEINKIILKHKKHLIFFNQYHFTNQIIKNICVANNLPYSEVEIDNYKHSFRVSSGKKILINHFNYSLVKNKILKVGNYCIDEVLFKSNDCFFKNHFFNKIKFLFQSIFGYATNNFLKSILTLKPKKFRKYNKIYLLQCSHDSSILCASQLNIQDYLSSYLYESKKNDLVVLHPEERSLKFIFLVLSHCLKNNIDLDVSIKNLKSNQNYSRDSFQFKTLSSTSLDKLLNV